MGNMHIQCLRILQSYSNNVRSRYLTKMFKFSKSLFFSGGPSPDSQIPISKCLFHMSTLMSKRYFRLRRELCTNMSPHKVSTNSVRSSIIQPFVLCPRQTLRIILYFLFFFLNLTHYFQPINGLHSTSKY